MKIFKQFNIKEYNSYRLDAVCKKVYFPENEQDVIDFFNSETEYILLGSGHNILLTKSYYDSPFIIMDHHFGKTTFTKNIVEVEAGACMRELSLSALKNGLSGIEFFYDIPSSLGGAVVMNAGANGEEIKDILFSVRYLDLSDMSIKEKSSDEIGFKYRNSVFQENKNKIVLKARLKLNIKDPTLIRSKMDAIKDVRWAKQPKEYPNAGSVFKRPEGRFVGPMLDELQLRGFSIGDAQVSEKHSGFIVNKGNATGQDILQLIEQIQKKVKDKFNIMLEVEQRII
jgi:UDP-N-acetylmuramate dehydrogenase